MNVSSNEPKAPPVPCIACGKARASSDRTAFTATVNEQELLVVVCSRCIHVSAIRGRVLAIRAGLPHIFRPHSD